MSDLECVRCGVTDDPDNGIVVMSVNYEHPDRNENFPNVYHEEICTVCREDELREDTVLSPRQSEIQALVEAGWSRGHIADYLGISKNTVDDHKQAIKEKIRQAKSTTNHLRKHSPRAIPETASVSEQ